MIELLKLSVYWIASLSMFDEREDSHNWCYGEDWPEPVLKDNISRLSTILRANKLSQGKVQRHLRLLDQIDFHQRRFNGNSCRINLSIIFSLSFLATRDLSPSIVRTRPKPSFRKICRSICSSEIHLSISST